MRDFLKKNQIISVVDLISYLRLTNLDINVIFEKFKSIIDNPEVNEFIEYINQLEDIKDEYDLETIIKYISENVNLDRLNLILVYILKDEYFVDFIQDLFLEKLL